MNLTQKQLAAYSDMIAADGAWQDELERVYGRNAGDARYDSRGTATQTLFELKTVFRRASIAWNDSCRKVTV